jgi:hypothetical protein
VKSIQALGIADMHCDQSADIVAVAQEKLNTGVQPQTVSNQMSHLAAVFSIARPAWGFPLDQQAMDDARRVSDRLCITGKSRGRDRRPSLEERDQSMQHCLDRSKQRPSSIRMHRIIAFAIFSTRRQEEIIHISWEDLGAGVDVSRSPIHKFATMSSWRQFATMSSWRRVALRPESYHPVCHTG